MRRLDDLIAEMNRNLQVAREIIGAVLTLITLPITYAWACVLRERLGRRAELAVAKGP